MAIQKIDSPPVNVPLAPRATQGCLRGCGGMLDLTFSRCFGRLHPKTTSTVEKCFLGQSLPISELLKLLFNLFRSLKSTLRTRHTAGKAENKCILQLLSGFGGEISPKKPSPISPSLLVSPSMAMGKDPWLGYLVFPVVTTGSAFTPQTVGTFNCLF